MEKTQNAIIKILVIVPVLILFYFLVIFTASVVQLAEAADRIYLGLGQPIFLSLMLFLVGIIVAPLYIYFKFPRALLPPEEPIGTAHDKFMSQLRSRLIKNPELSGVPLENDDDVIIALKALSQDADKVIRETAGTVFISTAISQNGRLDGLITLATQARMVWKIACAYQQRPSPRQMLYLYSNVAVNAFMAESIDDVDLTEVMAPMLTTAGISTASVVPGMSLVVNSVANGTANAFLTLRVGCIAKQYCTLLVRPSSQHRKFIRRSATVDAAAMVVNIVKDNGSRIISEFWKMASDKVTGLVDSSLGAVKNVAGKVSDTVVQSAQSVEAAVGKTTDGATKYVASKLADSAVTGGRTIAVSLDQVAVIAKSSAGKVAEAANSCAQTANKVVAPVIGSVKEASSKASESVIQGTHTIGRAASTVMSSAANVFTKNQVIMDDGDNKRK